MRTKRADFNGVTVDVDHEWVTMSLQMPLQGFCMETGFERGAWDLIEPCLARLHPGRCHEIRAVSSIRECGVLEFEFGSEWRSIYNLASAFDAYTTVTQAMTLAGGWSLMSEEERLGRWWGADPQAAQSQILAKCWGSVRHLEQLPRWLPSLIESADRSGVGAGLSIGVVGWEVADTPLGKTCIATVYGEEETYRKGVAVSDCPAWVPDQLLPEERMAVLGSLDSLLDLIIGRAAKARQNGVWLPTGHESLRIRATIQQWSEPS
jgi:hypothetical protein